MVKIDDIVRRLPREVRELVELILDTEEKLGIPLLPNELSFIRNIFASYGYDIIRTPSGFKIEPISDDVKDIEELEEELEDIEPIRPLKTYPDFLEPIFSNPAGVHLIIGKIGSGKTALSLRLAEIFRDRTGNPVYVMNMPRYPSWIEGEIANLRGIEFNGKVDVVFELTTGGEISGNNTILIIDDASTLFDSWKRDERNRTLKYLMFIARHKDCAVIINSQEASSINKYIAGQAKSIWLKEPSILTEEVERRIVAKLAEEARDRFSIIPPEERSKYAYVATADGKALVKVSLPHGWDDSISRNKGVF